MIDKSKIVKYTGITLMSGLILYGGVMITIDELLLAHEIHPCIISKVLGMEHRLNKIRHDKDVIDVEYLSIGNKKVGKYNIESPAIIINKEGMKDFYGKEVPYKETKIVELDSEYDSEHVYYIKSMER